MKCLTTVNSKQFSQFLAKTILVMAVLLAFSQTVFGLSVTAPVDSLPIGASVNDFDGDHHFLQTLEITLDVGEAWAAGDDITITMPTGVSVADPNNGGTIAEGISVSLGSNAALGVNVVSATASVITLDFTTGNAAQTGDKLTVIFPIITSPSLADGDTASYLISQVQDHETTDDVYAKVTFRTNLNLVTFAANYSGGTDTTDTDGDQWPNDGGADAITAALPDWVTDQTVNVDGLVNGTDTDFESITLDNNDATHEITFTLWASKLDTIKKISAATAGVQEAINVTSGVQITDNEGGTMNAEYLNSSLLEEGAWYFYVTSSLTADWVVGMSDAVHIRHYPHFTDTDNDAIGIDYDDDGLVEPAGDDDVSSVTLDVSGGLGAGGELGTASIDDIDFFVSIRDYDDEASFQIFRAPTSVTINSDSIKTSGTSPNIVVTGLGGATAITSSAQTAYLPYSFYNYEAIRSDTDFDAVGSYQIWVVANDGKHQALQRIKNQGGGLNLQLDIKTFPYFVFDDQYYNDNITINTAVTQYITINWGRLVNMDNELDGDMIINLYCSDLGYADAGGHLTPASVDTNKLPQDVIDDAIHTVHIATIVDTSDTKQANRYMWDVRNSGLAAGNPYYLYAVVTSDGDAAVVSLNSDEDMGDDNQRSIDISHGSYFLPLNPVEGEVLSLGLGDTYILTWDAFDMDATASDLTVGAFMVTAGTDLDTDASGVVEFDEVVAPCYWLTTSDDGTTPIAYASAPKYADGKYKVDISVILDDIDDSGVAPSGTYDVYYVYDDRNDLNNVWDIGSSTVIKADGQLYFSGDTDKNGQYNYRLEPTRAMMEKGDTLTVTVYATDNVALANDPMWIEVYVNVPSEYFSVVDQDNATTGVQAFTPVTDTFNGSVTKNVATVVGTENQLDFASHYTNFSTKVNLANTAVATFQIVAKTDASGDVMENSNLTINNTGSRVSHMLDVNFTQFGTTVPPAASVISLAPRGKISGLVDIQARSDSGQVVTLWVCPTGSYDNITDATFLAANGDADATDGVQVTLGANGSYTLSSVPVGKYDVLCEKAGWTIQKVANQTVQAYSTTSVNFYNAEKLLAGDCVGYDHDGNSATTSLPDNQIDTSDRDVFEAAYESTPSDTNWNTYCDVDNDNIITVSDIAYMAENLTTSGDGILYKGQIAAEDAETLAKLIVLKQDNKFTTFGIVAENYPAMMAYSAKVFINAKQWELVSFEDKLHGSNKFYFEKQNGYNHDFVCASIGNNGSKDMDPMLVNFTLRALVENPEEPKINDAMLVDVYHRVNIPTITSAIEDGNALPTEFSLSKNYPNPFNPTTTIEFALPKTSDVKIVVFNTLGQKVRTLVSTKMSAGYYKSIWDSCDDFGKRVSSGMYFYRLEVNNQHISTQKMLLLK